MQVKVYESCGAPGEVIDRDATPRAIISSVAFVCELPRSDEFVKVVKSLAGGSVMSTGVRRTNRSELVGQ